MKKLLLVLLIVSCSTSQDEKLHAESVETHDLAIKIGEHVGEKIRRIEMHVQKLEDPLKPLLQDSVRVLTEDYAYWESTIVEVPVHAHNQHDHDHAGHDHNHAPGFTPEIMLNIQRDLRYRIVKLNIRVQNY